MKFEAPPGTHDVLAKDWPHWQRTVREVEGLCRLYGYEPITTPVFEDTDLFLRTSGGGSDVVQKEMYTFEDRGGRSLTLRPEGTAPIARAYLEHGLHREPQPQKLFTIVPMYRYARPQRGRYREHWHISVEAIGSADPAIDAELIQLYDTLLGRLRVTEYRLDINTIGDANCRPQYVEELVAWLNEHDDALDQEAREKRDTNPLRVFDVKNDDVRAALREAPDLNEYLCDECREHFAAVRAFLDAYGVKYEIDHRLVRGLDYYTRTTWEFIGPEEGAQSTISGGGRYDYLIEEIGGPPTPGVGFGAGVERLHLALGGAPAESRPLDVFFAVEDASRRADVLRAIASLRAEGYAADTDYAGRSLKGQLTQGQRLGAETVVIAQEGGFTVRRGGQEDVELERLEDLEL
ncbi:MAG TPA: histidine--tRNA ligase [Gaiellaceae bacterium]|nr:histidine--tRNA ligase [Gaiellaceae bacterium]